MKGWYLIAVCGVVFFVGLIVLAVLTDAGGRVSHDNATDPAVETRLVRCEAGLRLRETTVQAGVGNTNLAGNPVSLGRLPRAEYDRLMSEAVREIRQFC